MKNYFKLTIILICFSSICRSQNWTCLHGEKRSAGLGQYEEKGNSGLPFRASARNLATGCIANNEYYLFGGFGFNKQAKKVPLNDFWKYNFDEHQWVRISGDTGVQLKQMWNFENKIVNTFITPSPRSGACSWFYNNRFYLFGGTGIDENGKYFLNNQLWYYDLSKKVWIFSSGDTINNSTIQMNENSLPLPSAREKSACWQWNDKVFILGGNGINRKGAHTQLTDFWSLDLSTKKWKEIYTDSSEYQSQLVAFSNNSESHPKFLESPCTWVLDNYLILYGGKGYNSDRQWMPLSDLWVYDIMNKRWKKISMELYKNIDIVKERYNTNHPGVRSNALCWSYNNRIYLFGGISIDSKGSQGMMNDLWNYDFEKNRWARMDGNPYNEVNAPVHFDHATMLETEYSPGARINALAFTNNHALYLFGGVVKNEHYADLYNDFWKYPIPIEEQNKKRTVPISLLLGSAFNENDNAVSQPNNYEAPISEADILVYNELYFTPNPAIDKVFIYSSKLIPASSFQLINQSGTVVQIGNTPELLPNQKYSIDLSSLPKGNYFFKLKDNKSERSIYFSKL